MPLRQIAIGLGLVVLSFANPRPDSAQQPAAPVYNPTNPQPMAASKAPSVAVGSDNRVTFRMGGVQALNLALFIRRCSTMCFP